METKTIEYETEKGTVRITVSRATVLMGTTRIVMREQFKEEGRTPEERIVGLRVMPPLVACATEVEGIPWPITFEQFCELDEELVDTWYEAVRELNPHWYAFMDEETLAKKASGSTESLPNGSRTEEETTT